MVLTTANDNNYPISTLNDCYVRMLANAVFAAPLLHWFQSPGTNSSLGSSEPRFVIDNHYWDWLSQLDRKPEAFHAWLQQGELRKLGIVHERLWQYFLANNGLTSLIASNLPIWDGAQSKQLQGKNQRRQLGELDILYEHPDWGIVHLEIASKYFLHQTYRYYEENNKLSATEMPNSAARPICSPTSTENRIPGNHLKAWSHWLGPGGRDRLDLKLSHILNKQIALLDNPFAEQEVEALLQSQSLPDINADPNRVTEESTLISRHVHVGGRLFYPAESAGQSVADSGPLTPLSSFEKLDLTPALRPDHLKGLWFKQSQWKSFANKNNSMSVRLVNKPFWLDHIERLAEEMPSNLATLHSAKTPHWQFDQGLIKSKLDNPVMVQVQLSNNFDKNEQALIAFITPDHWPDDSLN